MVTPDCIRVVVIAQEKESFIYQEIVLHCTVHLLREDAGRCHLQEEGEGDYLRTQFMVHGS